MGYSGNNGPEQLKAIRNLKGRHSANSFKSLRKRTELKIEELHVDKPSPAVMAAIRADIEAERKRRNRWLYGIMAGCVAVMIGLLYYLDTTAVTNGVMTSIDECNQVEREEARFECHYRKGMLNFTRYPELSMHHFEEALLVYPNSIRARERLIRLLIDQPISSEHFSRIDEQIRIYQQQHGDTEFLVDYKHRFEMMLQNKPRWESN
ncbi:MAG: hypothetical protein HWE14_08390 [Flavobacteriia bacterium]|nr:hypothetical protein [Flavobacteriia bacterium]